MPLRWKKLFAFGAIYGIWGSTYLAILFAIETMPPFLMTGIRFLIAGAILSAWGRLRGETPLAAKDLRAALVLGVLMNFGGMGLVTWAEQYVASGPAALMCAMSAVWIPVLDAAWFRGPRFDGRLLFGLACGVAGVALLVNPFQAGSLPLGATCVLVASSVAWSSGALLSRRLLASDSFVRAVGAQSLAGALVLFVAGAAAGERLNLAHASLSSWMGLLYLALLGSVVALFAYLWLLRHASASAVATHAFINPLVALLLGWAIMDERIDARIVLASVLILGSVALLQRRTGS